MEKIELRLIRRSFFSSYKVMFVTRTGHRTLQGSHVVEGVRACGNPAHVASRADVELY